MCVCVCYLNYCDNTCMLCDFLVIISVLLFSFLHLLVVSHCCSVVSKAQATCMCMWLLALLIAHWIENWYSTNDNTYYCLFFLAAFSFNLHVFAVWINFADLWKFLDVDVLVCCRLWSYWTCASAQCQHWNQHSGTSSVQKPRPQWCHHHSQCNIW